MSKLRTAASFVTCFNARYTQPGVIDVAAAGEVSFPADSEFSLDFVQAAGVRSFTAPGKLQNVVVIEHFLVLGETVHPGELLELPETDAKHVIVSGRARLATEEEIAAAQKQTKAGK